MAGADRMSPVLPEIVEDDQLAADNDVTASDFEIDSTFGDDNRSAMSQSIRSSIYNYRYENGRTYHAYHDGEYLVPSPEEHAVEQVAKALWWPVLLLVPNDEVEQDRLDLLHHLFKMILGGELLTAPLISSPKRVLDVGTGTGIWAIEFADQHPNTTVLGTDLSPIQPNWVPPNLQFYVEDCEADWSFPDSEKFDYIHGRALCGGIADWPRFYSQAFSNIEPGGWMEMQDHECWLNSDDGGMSSAPGCTEWIHEVDRASRIFGKPLNIAHQHRQWMIDAGFEDVHEVIKKIPIGPWAKDPKLKELGSLFRIQMIESIPSFMLAYYTRVLGHSIEKTQVTMATVRKEFEDRTLHLYLRWHFVTGRKPQ